MSDTQSSEEYEVRVQQKIEAKLRDLLDKAKSITPFYDDDTLLLIYKDCFHTDHVFINKLEIIAKNHKNSKQEQDKDWIQFKQQQNVKQRSIKNGDNNTAREKYNFLDDEELLQRAKDFDIERQRDLWERRKEQRRERQEYKYKNNKNKSKYQQKNQNQETTQAQKKLKFKEKVQPKTASSTTNHQTQVVEPAPKAEIKQVQPVQQANNKPAPKYAQKKQKVAEKKTWPVPSSKKQQIKQEPVETKKDVKQPQKLKYQEKKVELAPKPQAKTQAPAKQQTKTATIQQKVVESPTKKIGSQKQLEPDVKKEFEQSCRLNSFILKFIPPSSKLQKISYIRDPNGLYREVKTREPLVK